MISTLNSLLFIAGALGMLAIYSWIQLSSRINRLFAAMAVCMSVWAFLYYVELTASYDLRVAAMRIKFGFTNFLVYFLLRITREITGRPSWLQGAMWWLISVPAFLGTVYSLSSFWHGGFRFNFELAPVGNLQVLNFERGVFDMPLIVWFNLLALLNIGVLVHASITARGTVRKKAAWMVTAVGIPGIINAIQFAGLEFVAGINVAPWLFAITGPALFVAAFDLQTLDMVTRARDQLFDQSRKAYIMIDQGGLIQDFNDAFLRMLGRQELPIKKAWALGFPEPVWKRLENPVEGEESGAPVKLPHWEETRYFDITTQAMRDSSGEISAYVHIWEDVTRRIREHEEQKLVRQQELMLRDLHDGVGGIMAKVAMLADHASLADDLEAEKNLLRQIIGLAREGNMEVRTLMGSIERNEVTWPDFLAEMRRYGEMLFDNAGIAYELDVQGTPPEGFLPLVSVMSLHRACRECLHNISRHAESTRVSVTADFDEADLTVTVVDNGRGLPKDLEPGRGLGHIRRRVKELGGTVTFESRNGVTVTMMIPLPLQDLLREVV
ncbi:MAG: histidine kinase N-terminal 7TM domain-containing protein [Kiritimatiellia bacterium]